MVYSYCKFDIILKIFNFQHFLQLHYHTRDILQLKLYLQNLHNFLPRFVNSYKINTSRQTKTRQNDERGQIFCWCQGPLLLLMKIYLYKQLFGTPYLYLSASTILTAIWELRQKSHMHFCKPNRLSILSFCPLLV